MADPREPRPVAVGIDIGGGISKDHAKLLPRFRARARLVAAQLFNDAGIVGAAFATAVPEATGGTSQ